LASSPFIARKPETLLKASLFAVAAWFAGVAAASGAGVTELVLGNVRDQTGQAIAGARVEAFDAAGQALAAGTTDPQGSFAIAPSAAPVTLRVRCLHCATLQTALHGRTNLALIVQRYAALQSDVPTASDLAALPYARIVDDLGLIPYALPSTDGTNISDRGLGLGHGLVADDTAPIFDLATGTSALADFPDRYARTIQVTAPADAFRYGSNAGGGRFALDQLDGDASAASLDSGLASSLAAEPAFGIAHPSVGVSSDGGMLSRRGDLDFATPFAGGFLRAGADSVDLDATQFGLSAALDLARVSYATASRRYRTFFDLSASDVGVENDALGDTEYRSSYLSTDFRVEHPGPVMLAFGGSATEQTAFYVIPNAGAYHLTGRYAQETAYAEASAGDAATGVTAGLGLTNAVATETLEFHSPAGDRLLLVPSVTAHAALGDGAYVRAGFSESTHVPSLLEADADPNQAVFELDRGELAETALGFDSGRIRSEAIVYQEFLQGFDRRRLDGIGASLTWQIAPLVSVRAWTLRDVPLDYLIPNALALGSARAIPFSTTVDLSRQIAWATYTNGSDGLRFDAIAHRDVAPSGAIALGIDGDVYVPLVAHLGLDAGTSQRTTRSYFFGLRAH